MKSKQEPNRLLIAKLKQLKLYNPDKSLTNKRIGELIGEPETTVKNYMRGRPNIPEEHLITLSRELLLPDGYWDLAIGKPLLRTPPPVVTAEGARYEAPSQKSEDYLAKIGRQALEDISPDENYRVFVVDGLSMMPNILPGDRLICKRVEIDKIRDNRVHVMIVNRRDLNEARPNRIWVKRCALRNNGSHVNCYSDNKDSSEPYVTFPLKRSEIDEVWYPVRRVTGHMADPNRDIYEQLDELRERIEVLESMNE